MISALYQVVPRFLGTNAAYYHQEELDKRKTGGGVFLILTVSGGIDELQDAESDYAAENRVCLYGRSDETFTPKQLKALAERQYRAREVRYHSTVPVRAGKVQAA